MNFIVARLWIVLVFGTIVHAKSRIPGPNMLAFNFAKPKEGRKLNGNMIKEISVIQKTTVNLSALKKKGVNHITLRRLRMKQVDLCVSLATRIDLGVLITTVKMEISSMVV